MSALSTIERIGSSKISQSEVDWVIGSAGQPAEQPDLKKPTTLRGVVGVWNCESGDCIRGRDGACFHAVGFLVRSERLEGITNVTAFSFCARSPSLDCPLVVRSKRLPF